MQIEWSEQALSDIGEIRAFIARDAPAYADLVVDRIFEGTEHLVTFPEAGRVVPEFARQELREFIQGNYRVVYQVQRDAVSIVTVFHSARLLGPEHLKGLRG